MKLSPGYNMAFRLFIILNITYHTLCIMGWPTCSIKGQIVHLLGFANHMFSVKIYLGWVSKQLWMIQKQDGCNHVPGKLSVQKNKGGYLGLWAKVCRLWFSSHTLPICTCVSWKPVTSHALFLNICFTCIGLLTWPQILISIFNIHFGHCYKVSSVVLNIQVCGGKG